MNRLFSVTLVVVLALFCVTALAFDGHDRSAENDWKFGSINGLTPAAVGSSVPNMNSGSGSAGTAVTAMRSDAVAPTDTSRAHSGANSDITSLSGLNTPLSVGQGGTGSGTASGALSNLGGASYLSAANTLAAAPSTPVDGGIYIADGVNWNPASLTQTVETAATIALVSGTPATITDSGSGFVTAGFLPGQWITVYDNTTGTALGTFELAQTAAGTLTLITGQTLTSKGAGDSITITGNYPYSVVYSAYGNGGSAEYLPIMNTVGANQFRVTASPTTTGTTTINLATTAKELITPVNGDTQTITLAFSHLPSNSSVRYVHIQILTPATGTVTMIWPTANTYWMGGTSAQLTALSVSKHYDYVCEVGGSGTYCSIIGEGLY